MPIFHARSETGRRALSASLLTAVGLTASVLISAGSVEARQSGLADSRAIQSQNRATIDAKLDERLARDWGLRSEEWARYQQLMQGPLGIYSPNIDPLTALGIEARSNDERRRYAELQVQAEGRRVSKIFDYQRAYDEAWKRLYPTLDRVSRVGSVPSSGFNPIGRLAVFVKDGCVPCEMRVKRLQEAGSAFDLYLVGSRQDDARIRQWASRSGIDPAKVRSRVITLNHDAGRWLSIGGKGELPAVMREINGRWERQ